MEVTQVQENYCKENYPSWNMLGNNLQLKPLKDAKFSLKNKILSSTHVQPPLKYTPYDSILPQKSHDSQGYDGLSDIEPLKDDVFAIIIDTRSDNYKSKFKNETLLNYDDYCFINENSIIYERGTNCILSYEEVEQNDDDEINNLDQNVDKSLIISVKKCFNCLSPHHSYNDCQLPLNQELIKINREKFNSIGGQQQFNSRYYIEYEKDLIFNIFSPGVISDALKHALGILESGDEPPYYKRMRVFGYPPGYWGDKVGDDRLSKLELENWNSATLKIYGDVSTDDDSDNSENEKESSSEVVENCYYQYHWTIPDWYNNGYSGNACNWWYNYQEPPHTINNNIEQPPPPGTTSNLGQLQQPPSSWIISSLETYPPPPGIIPLARTFNDSQQSPVHNASFLPCQNVPFSIPSLSEQIQQRSEDQIMKKSNPYNNIEIPNVEEDIDMDLSE
ncbi:4353_t:CDS:2 [Funneliformis caledonium]|uniref:4353_t:CDS:1 n=1 Tax=Funneliformis caledonium TaxID=1117310 RepID=A0A9N9HAP1_9GLOM|nr:4353_t:CDS:2 [Funneliformis caledonium]